MNPKLLEVLKKAKEVDQRAKKFDSTDSATLQANVNNRKPTPTMTESMGGMNMLSQQQMMTEQPLQSSRPTPKVDVNSETYKQRVKESKLPPEIMQAMLDNPIQQPDAPGTFSMDEETIKQVNPNYGKQIVNETINPTPNIIKETTVNESSIRKMIAEEIAKALPSIVEKYFDKKMIQENVKVLNALRKRKTSITTTKK